MIGIQVSSKNWTAPHKKYVRIQMKKIVKLLKLDGEISILLTDDKTIQDLNKTYRNKDIPTNVLSFETQDSEMLGDIVLAFETIAREATEQKKIFEYHLTHLLIHGTLHLIGYDHITESDAEKMEAKEETLLKTLF